MATGPDCPYPTHGGGGAAEWSHCKQKGDTATGPDCPYQTHQGGGGEWFGWLVCGCAAGEGGVHRRTALPKGALVAETNQNFHRQSRTSGSVVNSH